MLNNAVQEPPQQYMQPRSVGVYQRWTHRLEFAQCVRKAQPQWVDPVLHRRFDHQPSHQEVQDDVACYLELNRFGTATAQVAFHPLVHFQFSIGCLDRPDILPPKAQAFI